MNVYTIKGIAQRGQSDEGKERQVDVIAYAPEQALVWAQRDWQGCGICWVMVTGIVAIKPYTCKLPE